MLLLLPLRRQQQHYAQPGQSRDTLSFSVLGTRDLKASSLISLLSLVPDGLSSFRRFRIAAEASSAAGQRPTFPACGSGLLLYGYFSMPLGSRSPLKHAWGPLGCCSSCPGV